MDKCSNCQIEIIMDDDLTDEQREKILALCPKCYDIYMKDYEYVKNTHPYLH